MITTKRDHMREGRRYNYGLGTFDVSTAAKLDELTPAEATMQLSGSMTGLPGVQSGAGVTSGVAEVRGAA